MVQATVRLREGGKVSSALGLRLGRVEERDGEQLKRTSKVPLTLLEPKDLAHAPSYDGREARNDDKPDGDDVQVCELLGGEGEGYFGEEKRRGEEGDVDCEGGSAREEREGSAEDGSGEGGGETNVC